ncbi:MAG: hypothetical protein MZV70_49530 [Desulfobacterales bacterium]|nr:hypothetical protein [Desulfobacterales bacterium]
MGTEPPLRFVTGFPARGLPGADADRRRARTAGAACREIKGRKVSVAVTLSADGSLCARGDVVTVQMPEDWMEKLKLKGSRGSNQSSERKDSKKPTACRTCLAARKQVKPSVPGVSGLLTGSVGRLCRGALSSGAFRQYLSGPAAVATAGEEIAAAHADGRPQRDSMRSRKHSL